MNNQCLTTTDTGQGIYALTQQLSFDSSATPTELVYIQPCQTVYPPEVIYVFEFALLFFVFWVVMNFVIKISNKLL